MKAKERIVNSIMGLPTDRPAWCPFLAYYWEHLPIEVQKKGQLSYMKEIGADPLLRGMAELSRNIYHRCETTESYARDKKQAVFQTPVGMLRLEYTYSSRGNTWFLTGHPVQTAEDFRILQYIYENLEIQENILPFEQ